MDRMIRAFGASCVELLQFVGCVLCEVLQQLEEGIIITVISIRCLLLTDLTYNLYNVLYFVYMFEVLLCKGESRIRFDSQALPLYNEEY